MTTGDDEFIEPADPLRDELLAFAESLRARLDPGWRAWVAAAPPDTGLARRLRVVISHVLTSRRQWDATSIAGLEEGADRILAKRHEFDVVKSFPGGAGPPLLLGRLREGISYGWTPEIVFEIGQTLYRAEFIGWEQIGWLIEAGIPWQGWPPEQRPAVDRVVAPVRALDTQE